MTDIVFNICKQMLKHSSEHSFKRLNPALRNTLANCIEADLPFQRSTFKRIYNELRGSWWFGDGAGSSPGEHYYTTACACNHSSAQQSFEHFADRPACLWDEQAKTPKRLHVGTRFTWQGYYVTVTSMRKDSLIACTYEQNRNQAQGVAVGATFGYDPEYLVVKSKKSGKQSIILTVHEIRSTRGETKVARRFVIPYNEIAAFRRAAKSRLKTVVSKIAECDPGKDSAKLTDEINAAHFRHFELEEIRSAFAKRKHWIANNDLIEEWRQGKKGSWLATDLVALRIRGNLVECSNGNAVSRSAVEMALPVVFAHRGKTAAFNLPLDSFHIDGVNGNGVRIGCTIVPWKEVELISETLTNRKEP